MNALYDLKDMLVEQLEEYGKKGELSSSVLDKVDTLAHAAKNIGKVIEDCENEENGMSDNRSSYRRSGNYDGRGSYRRGRSSRSRSYSRGRSFADQLYSMMDENPEMDEQTKQEMERLAARMDQI